MMLSGLTRRTRGEEEDGSDDPGVGAKDDVEGGEERGKVAVGEEDAVARGDLEEERGEEAGGAEEVEVGEESLCGVGEEKRGVLAKGGGDGGFREAMAVEEDEDVVDVCGGGRGAIATRTATKGQRPQEETR